MTSIQTAWSSTLSGGYQRHNNPQIYFTLDEPKKVVISLERITKDAPCGIIFFISQNVTGQRLKSIDKPQFQSPYWISNSMKFEVNLHPGPYTITACLQTPGIESPLELKFSEPVQNLRVLPDYKRHIVEGNWKADENGGYMSLSNPQIPLHISKNGSYMITLDTKASHKGVIFFLLHWDHTNRKRRSHTEPDIVSQSRYMITNSLTEETQLNAGRYIIVPCARDLKSGSFKIIVESNDDGVETLLPQIANRGDNRPQVDCSEVLKQFHLEGGVFYTQNPQPALLQYLRSQNAVFRDSQFPPTDASLYDTTGQRTNKLHRSIVQQWRRGSEINDAPALFYDGIDIHDALQGQLGDCWLMQSIAALSMCPERTQAVFPQEYNECGLVVLRLYFDNTEHYVVLDDNLPCTSDGKIAFARSSDENELWPCFIEKAIAKIFGSYEGIVCRAIAIGLQYLTGGKIDTLTNGDSDGEVWDTLQEYTKNNWIVGLCSTESPDGVSEKIRDNGIVSMHAYSLINVFEVPAHIHQSSSQPLRLCQIRNTWGYSEWNGAWSDKSAEWKRYPQVAPYVGHVDKDDGVFFMPFSDMRREFHHMTCCKLVANDYPFSYKYQNSFRANVDGGYMSATNPHVPFTVSQRTKVIARANLIDQKKNRGLCLCICRGKFGKERIDDEMIYKSEYLSSTKVLLECTLEPCEQYVAYVVSERIVKKDIPVRIHLQTDREIDYNVPLKEYFYCKYNMEGQPWKPCGGYASLRNPQWRINTETDTELVIRIKSSYESKTMGMRIFIYVAGIRQAEWLQENRCVSVSQYLLTDTLSHECTLPAGNFIMLVCLQNADVPGAMYDLHVKANADVEVSKY